MPDPISTAYFPGDDMSPEAIRTAAGSLRTVGTDLAKASSGVVKTWGGIAHSYSAPESGSLVAAMNPLTASGATFSSDMGSAGTALETFASAVEAIKATLDGVRTDAYAFLATIHGGMVTATVYGNDESQTHTKDVPWYEDAVTVAKNNALEARVQAQADLLRAAEQRCANDIVAAVDSSPHTENGGPGLRFGPVPAVENPPWGAPVEFPELLDDPVGRALKKVLAENIQGLASLAGFDTSHYAYDLDDTRGSDDLTPMFTHGWSLSNTWNSLMGIGTFADGLNPLAPVLSLVPGWYGQHYRDAITARDAFAKSLVASKDWAKHPAEAFFESVLNIGSIAVGVTKIGSLGRLGEAGRAGDLAEAGNAAKAADAGSAASRASALDRLAQVGARVGRSVTVPTVNGLKALSEATHLDTALRKIVDRIPVHIKVPDEAVTVERPSVPHHEVPPSRVPERETVSERVGSADGPGDRAGAGGDHDVQAPHERVPEAETPVNHDPGGSSTAAGPGSGGPLHGASTAPNPAAGAGQHPTIPAGQAIHPWEERPSTRPGTHVIDDAHPKLDLDDLSSRDRGAVGEKLTQQRLEDDGWTLFRDGRQTHVRLPDKLVDGVWKKQYFIPDFIAAKDGKLMLVESKTGDGAHFTVNQLDGYGLHGNPGGSVLKARSALAQDELDAWLDRNGGLSGRVDAVQVDRWNVEIVPDQGLRQASGVDQLLGQH